MDYTIIATYLGPCTDVQLPPQTTLVQAEQGGSGNVTGLEEFSRYIATVTPLEGRRSSSIEFTTLAAGKY